MTWLFVIATIICAPMAAAFFIVAGGLSVEDRKTPAGYAFFCGMLLLILALGMSIGLGSQWSAS